MSKYKIPSSPFHRNIPFLLLFYLSSLFHLFLSPRLSFMSHMIMLVFQAPPCPGPLGGRSQHSVFITLITRSPARRPLNGQVSAGPLACTEVTSLPEASLVSTVLGKPTAGLLEFYRFLFGLLMWVIDWDASGFYLNSWCGQCSV